MTYRAVIYETSPRCPTCLQPNDIRTANQKMRAVFEYNLTPKGRLSKAIRDVLTHHIRQGDVIEITQIKPHDQCVHGIEFPCRLSGTPHSTCDYTGLVTPDTLILRG